VKRKYFYYFHQKIQNQIQDEIQLFSKCHQDRLWLLLRRVRLAAVAASQTNVQFLNGV
jgi:hypothetical protein